MCLSLFQPGFVSYEFFDTNADTFEKDLAKEEERYKGNIILII